MQLLKDVIQSRVMPQFKVANENGCDWVCPHCGQLVEGVEWMPSRKRRLAHCSCLKSVSEYNAAMAKKQREADYNKGLELLGASKLDHVMIRNISFNNYNPNSRNLANGQVKLQTAIDYCKEVQHGEKNFLAITGEYGTGKTHLAVSILKRLVMTRLWSARFVLWPDALGEIKSSWGTKDSGYLQQAIFGGMKKCDLLVIDDIDKASPTAWAMEQLYMVIDYRYTRQKPTVITANRGLGEGAGSLKDFWKGHKVSYRKEDSEESERENSAITDKGVAILDRVVGQLWANIAIVGSSYRQL